MYSLAYKSKRHAHVKHRIIGRSELLCSMICYWPYYIILSLCCRSKDFLCERRDVSLYMYKCIVFSTPKIRYFVKPHCCIDMLSYFLIVKCCLSDLQLAVEFVYCLVLIEVLAKVNKIQCRFTKHLQWSWWK